MERRVTKLRVNCSEVDVNEKCTVNWIGRVGPHHRLARSPDITLCDVFLWGWVKEEVKRSQKSFRDLELAMRDVLSNVPSHFMREFVENVNKIKKMHYQCRCTYLDI